MRHRPHTRPALLAQPSPWWATAALRPLPSWPSLRLHPSRPSRPRCPRRAPPPPPPPFTALRCAWTCAARPWPPRWPPPSSPSPTPAALRPHSDQLPPAVAPSAAVSTPPPPLAPRWRRRPCVTTSRSGRWLTAFWPQSRATSLPPRPPQPPQRRLRRLRPRRRRRAPPRAGSPAAVFPFTSGRFQASSLHVARRAPTGGARCSTTTARPAGPKAGAAPATTTAAARLLAPPMGASAPSCTGWRRGAPYRSGYWAPSPLWTPTSQVTSVRRVTPLERGALCGRLFYRGTQLRRGPGRRAPNGAMPSLEIRPDALDSEVPKRRGNREPVINHRTTRVRNGPPQVPIFLGSIPTVIGATVSMLYSF